MSSYMTHDKIKKTLEKYYIQKRRNLLLPKDQSKK